MFSVILRLAEVSLNMVLDPSCRQDDGSSTLFGQPFIKIYLRAVVHCSLLHFLSHRHKPQEQINQWCRHQQPVKPIQQTAMTGQYIPRIFHADIPFEQGLY